MSAKLKRRDFITLLGGAVAWPLVARAQQPKIIRLGYLEPQRSTDAIAANLRRQFLLGLRDLGYVEGRQLKMEDRSANGQPACFGYGGQAAGTAQGGRPWRAARGGAVELG
jgi:hypothetical protein